MKKTIGILLALLVIIGGYFLFKSYSKPASEYGTDNDGTEVTDTTPVATTTVGVTAGKEVNVTVTGSNFAFAPKTITVNKGDKVTVHFANSGGTHDFVIDEFNVRTPRISGGQSADVSFVADKSGSFEYYCSVGTHRAMGMWGTLTVN